MKRMVLGALCAACVLATANCFADNGGEWQLGIQSYILRKMPFDEAVKASAEMGLKVIEGYPNHGLTRTKQNLTLHYKMRPEARQLAKEILAKYDVKMVSYGVVSLPNDEAKSREVFDFAKEMGIETIVAEPNEDAFDLVDKLAQEYDIKVAIHNHPEPSAYWNPDKVVEVCKGRSKYIGACADTGHWMRSGIDPLQAIKKLEGRIIELHFKDLNEFGDKGAHDVPWGTGKGNVKMLLAELKRQGFVGVFAMEYEYDTANLLPEVKQCVDYFNKTVPQLNEEVTMLSFDNEQWKVGTALYSFNRYPLVEAIDKASEAGVNWIEGFSWHQLSKQKQNVQLDHRMRYDDRIALKKKMRGAGVKMISYYSELPNDEAGCRQVFDFAKDMGIEIIVTEPEPAAFDMVDRLAQEYQIKVAVHNHPKETADFPHKSLYWDPENVVKVVNGRSKWVGACADTGHWARCGINAVEGLKKLEGRVFEVHMKDLNEFGNPKDAHDVPWGTGATGIKEVMAELKRQNFAGPVMAEYEYNWLQSVPEIRQSVEFFNKTSAELGMTDWKPLMEKDLGNCQYKEGSWEFADGVLTRKGGGDIWTKEKYGDFVLDIEFKVDSGSNSGVFIRCGDIEHFVQTALEVQIHETTDGTAHGQCGAIYDCLSPAIDATKPAGEWNRYLIAAKGDKIAVVLNGTQIIDMDLSQWDRPGRNPDGTKNKFGNALKKFPKEGYIGLQDHGNPVGFRNMWIKPL